MTLPRWIDDELLERAYGLAQSAHVNEQVADRVLADAIAALQTRTNKSAKSLLQRLRGGHATMHPVATEAALLQRLLLEKSDEYARSEGNDEAYCQSEKTLLARYLHSVLLRSLQATSRWAAVGLCQLVYNYRGPQVDEMISSVLGREWDESNRKRVKKELMRYLTDRFAGLRVVVPSRGGDAHFVPTQNQERLRRYNADILTSLVPWGSEEHVLQAGMAPGNAPMLDESRYAQQTTYRVSPSKLEFNRYHVFVDPLCFTLLVRSICLASEPDAEGCLRLPQLQSCDGSSPRDPHNEHCNHAGSGPSQVRQRLELALEEQVKQRRELQDLEPLKIRVDGSRTAVVATSDTATTFTLADSATLVQVFAVTRSGEVLLATHILAHNEEGALTDSAGRLSLGRFRTLSFEVAVDSVAPAGMPASCTVRQHRLFSAAWRRVPVRMAWTGASAVLLLVFLLVWTWRSTVQHDTIYRADIRANGQPTQNRGARSYSLSPQKSRLGDTGPTQTVPLIRLDELPEIVLNLPVSAAGSYLLTMREADLGGSPTLATRLNAPDHNFYLELKVSTATFRANTRYVLKVSPEDQSRALSESEYFVFETGSR